MRWWEILVPLFVLVVGLNAMPTPRDNSLYAFLGVLISTLAAWFAVVLLRRCGLFAFLKKLGSEQVL